MTPEITVIIVNWNGGTFLSQCLHHLAAQTLKPARILLMDNDSHDGSAEQAAALGNVELHKLESNKGFSAANNRALELCTTPLVALLNPDAFPDTDWLENLALAAQARPDIASFGSRQLTQDAAALLDGTGDVYHISGLVWRNRYLCVPTPKDDIAKEIFSPCAGAALYRLEALRDVGGFDEDFFCYVEDVDLGFRLQLAGYKSLYVPDAVVRHAGGGTSGGRHSDFSLYHGHRNLVWTFIKNMPSALFWPLLPFHIGLCVMTIVYFALHKHGRVLLKSKIDAIKYIPRMWKKRATIQNARRVSVRRIWSLMDKRLILNHRAKVART